MKASRAWLLAVAASVCTAVAIPGIAYAIALAHVDGRPIPADPALSPASSIETAWQACGESLPVDAERMDPWRVSLMLVTNDRALDTTPGAQAAARIAMEHNAEHDVGRDWWHAANVALVIWITRNWSAEQMAATAVRDGLCVPRGTSKS